MRVRAEEVVSMAAAIRVLKMHMISGRFKYGCDDV